MPQHSLCRMPLKFAMICASNVNRSVAAHLILKEHGINVSAPGGRPCRCKSSCHRHLAASSLPTHLSQVESFGAGRHIKMPGPNADAPNVRLQVQLHLLPSAPQLPLSAVFMSCNASACPSPRCMSLAMRHTSRSMMTFGPRMRRCIAAPAFSTCCEIWHHATAAMSHTGTHPPTPPPTCMPVTANATCWSSRRHSGGRIRRSALMSA